jgi:putative membrane protein
MPTMVMPSAPFSWHDLGQWHLGVLPLILLGIAGVGYVALVRRTSGDFRGRTWYFMSGLLVTFFATQSVIGVFDMTYFADHMIEHLLLIMVAAPLFAMSRPLDLVRIAGPAPARQLLDSRLGRLVLSPIFGFGLYFVFIPVTHLTGLFNLMMEHEWVHHSEQILFLVVGYLFFRVAFGQEEGARLHPGLRLVFVMAAVPADTITGLSLAMSSHNPFPAYVLMGPAGSTAVSRLNDVHLGGAIMWIGGDALMLLACIPIAFIWLRYEAQRTKAIDAELDALGL